MRELTSQNPYTETFIGHPYVYTLDREDSQSVIQVMETIKNMNVSICVDMVLLCCGYSVQ